MPSTIDILASVHYRSALQGQRVVLAAWVFAMFSCFPPAITQAESIWIEGEEADGHSTTRHGWYDDVKKDVLSGEEWLSHFDASSIGTATYRFDVDEGGKYQFWIRANHLGASLAYRLDEEQWTAIDLSNDQRGAMNIAADNKPDLRFISWSKVGEVELSRGSHRIEFRMDSKAQNHGGIDCFCLTNEAWVPSGVNKPSSKQTPAAADEWFPVVLGTDPLSAESVIDISDSVEAPAGEHGFLQAAGASLKFAAAEQPVKFWGINASPGGKSVEEMEQAAAWYRKHGINLVRQHTVLGAVGLMDRNGNFDPQRLDRYDRWFATLKEHGIYSTWSVLYPHHGAVLQKHDGYNPALFAELDAVDEQHDGEREAITVNDFINIDPELQDALRKYFVALLNHKNPYTGLAYKDDPALAVLEFQNESNVFFHTLNSLRSGEPPLYARMMRKKFFDFVKAKYGTKVEAARAWGGRWDRDDDWEAGELGLMGAYHWGSDGPLNEFKGQTQRAADYIAFLGNLQRTYYSRREREVREIGFKGVTVATAWKSGGPGASMANLLADSAADMIDRHNYFGGGDGGHAITEGRVSNQTHLDQPGRGLLSLGLFQLKEKPFCISEWSMMPPAPYKAEAAPLIAFYGMGLQGWDVSCHFAMNGDSMGDGWPRLRKYVTETPHYIGQFPALAFAIHHNHIREGDIVAARELGPADVFAGRDVLGQSLAGGGWDAKELTGSLTTPPSTLAIGRVTIEFTRSPDSTIHNPAPYHDAANKQLVSTTEQLTWDYGRRQVQIRSPKTQGVVGFTDEQPVVLPAAKITLKTPFVSLILTPLDDLPLEESRQILITAMARDKQTGSEFNEDWSRLNAVGGPPLLMEPVQAKLQIAGARPTTVRPLDGYGQRMAQELPVGDDGSFTIDGRYRAYYYEVVR